MKEGEVWENLGCNVYGPKYKNLLVGKLVDVLIDGEYNTTLTVANEDGSFPWVRYNYTATNAGVHTITFNLNDSEYEGNLSYTVTVTELEKYYTLKVDTTDFTIGENATLKASIYYGNELKEEILENITKGKVVFKINGKTLKDDNGKVIYAKIVNGTATIENYEIPDTWNKKNITIEAVYSGSTQCDALRSDKQSLNITKAVPTITTSDITATTQSTITLTATVTDSDKVINTGKVVFKINGKTVKDANGKTVYAKITNNTATIEYTLPDTYKAKEYTLTATLVSSDYDRLTDTKTLTIQ